MKSLIKKLSILIEEGKSKEEAQNYEQIIIESIEEAINEESFYKLPINEIAKIIEKSNIEDVELLCQLAERASSVYKAQSALLIYAIKPKNANIDDCIKILSKFKGCQLCKLANELFEESHKLPVRDLESETGKEKNEKMEEAPAKVTKQPLDLENDICNAASEGNLTRIQHIVEKNSDSVETKDDNGRTPLNIAGLKGHLEVVQYLYEKCNANVETKDNEGFTPLNNSANEGHLEVVRYLCEVCNAYIETEDNYGYTPLNNALNNDHLEVVKYLYKTCHADVNTKDSNGYTPLNSYSYDGDLQLVKFLCEECHANTEIKDDHGDTPLISAIKNSHLEVIKYLYEKCKANIYVKDKNDNSLLVLATRKGDFGTVKYLCEQCNLEITDQLIEETSEVDIKKYLKSKQRFIGFYHTRISLLVISLILFFIYLFIIRPRLQPGLVLKELFKNFLYRIIKILYL